MGLFSRFNELLSGRGHDTELTVLCLDRSGSMASRDYQPSRIVAAKRAGQAFIDAKAELRSGDMVAGVVFDSVARVVMESTSVADATGAWARSVAGVCPRDGTRLAAGLDTCAMVVAGAPRTTGRRILLLTDGHGGDPREVAAELKRSGVVIDVVGIGGSPDDVAEDVLRGVASVIDGDVRYRFIKDAASLFAHFRSLATGIVKDRS